jgi:hypothetical protein
MSTDPETYRYRVLTDIKSNDHTIECEYFDLDEYNHLVFYLSGRIVARFRDWSAVIEVS